MGIAPCEAWAHRRRASLELMWPVSRGDPVGLHHRAQVAPAPDRFFFSGSFSSLHSFFFAGFRTTRFLDLVPRARPVKMISSRDN